jgi:hypothetical protein
VQQPPAPGAYWGRQQQPRQQVWEHTRGGSLYPAASEDQQGVDSRDGVEEEAAAWVGPGPGLASSSEDSPKASRPPRES